MREKPPFQTRFGDHADTAWPRAMRLAVERARRTGRRQIVRRSEWTHYWLVQEIR